MNDITKSPASLGYRIPAEWEKHDSLWLCWPHDSEDYPRGLKEIHETYIQIIKAIFDSEKVNLLIKENKDQNDVEEFLKSEGINANKINFLIIPFADIWIRDSGPIFITNKMGLAMTNWIFNAWGQKFKNIMSDTNIPHSINQTLQIPFYSPEIVFEGGSVDVNGKGTLLTTEQCLLNKNRNPGLSKEDIELYLTEYLGIKKIIWLKDGIDGDDTDGHIDDIARFVAPTTVLCAFEKNERDKNHWSLQKNYAILTNSTDQDGNKLNVIKLPMPDYVGGDKRRLPASYANFYIGNSVVLVPVFGHKNDGKALEIIQECFPERKAIGIDCNYLLHGGGAIHCISQQQPAV